MQDYKSVQHTLKYVTTLSPLYIRIATGLGSAKFISRDKARVRVRNNKVKVRGVNPEVTRRAITPSLRNSVYHNSHNASVIRCLRAPVSAKCTTN